jgi:hypothetical protein
MKYDQLSFVEAERVSGRRTLYLDFAISGQPLREIVEPGDFIGLFGWLDRSFELTFFARLLLREPSELPSGRVPIYICAECADLGCGAVTTRITKNDDSFVWSDFGFETNYENDCANSYSHVRNFVFQKTAYYRALNRFGFE